jgi:2-dehydro-3-deoxyglucarate aldolase
LSIVTDPRANPLRERIEADRVALGVLENVYSPSLVELYGELDLDFV